MVQETWPQYTCKKYLIDTSAFIVNFQIQNSIAFLFFLKRNSSVHGSELTFGLLDTSFPQSLLAIPLQTVRTTMSYYCYLPSCTFPTFNLPYINFRRCAGAVQLSLWRGQLFGAQPPPPMWVAAGPGLGRSYLLQSHRRSCNFFLHASLVVL